MKNNLRFRPSEKCKQLTRALTPNIHIPAFFSFCIRFAVNKLISARGGVQCVHKCEESLLVLHALLLPLKDPSRPLQKNSLLFVPAR